MKRILLVVAVVVVAPVIAFAAVMAATFAGQKEMVDGTELTDGARLVKDGFAAAFVLPAGDAEVGLIDCGNDPEGKAISLAELSRRGWGPIR